VGQYDIIVYVVVTSLTNLFFFNGLDRSRLYLSRSRLIGFVDSEHMVPNERMKEMSRKDNQLKNPTECPVICEGSWETMYDPIFQCTTADKEILCHIWYTRFHLITLCDVYDSTPKPTTKVQIKFM